MDVPKAYQGALNHDTPERDLALKKTQMESLLLHFRKHFKDPRSNNRSYRANSLLVFITMALLAGRNTLTQGRESDPGLRQSQYPYQRSLL